MSTQQATVLATLLSLNLIGVVLVLSVLVKTQALLRRAQQRQSAIEQELRRVNEVLDKARAVLQGELHGHEPAAQ